MAIDKFSFWCPIEKAQEQIIDPTTGEQVMRLGGIASTSDEDSDGEFLDPKGFDIKPLLESGMVNWHHQAKGQPGAIIGEPTKAEIRKEGLYLETDLYQSSEIARQVWDLAQTLDKNSRTRRLGYSIEGKVVKRKSNDPKDPGYKHIEKAIITGVAITHMPKNPKTFANIIKGEIDPEDYDDEEEEENENAEEKALDCESGAALKRESLDGAPKFLTKGEAMDKLFQDIPGITIDKAEQIYSLIKSISMAKERKEVTTEDIEKAYDALGIEKASTGSEAPEENIQKGDDEKEEKEEVEQPAEKEQEEDEKPEDGEGKEEVTKGGVSRFDEIIKAIETSSERNTTLFKALGVMVKDSAQRLEKASEALTLADERISSLEDIVKAQNDTIASMSDQLESFGAAPVQRAAVHARPIDRHFAKGGENEFNEQEPANEKRLSMSLQKGKVAELLDQATFIGGGYDQEFSKACTSFEASGTLTPSVIERIKNEFGYEIVK